LLIHAARSWGTGGAWDKPVRVVDEKKAAGLQFSDGVQRACVSHIAIHYYQVEVLVEAINRSGILIITACTNRHEKEINSLCCPLPACSEVLHSCIP
jgi:hypothetical protein